MGDLADCTFRTKTGTCTITPEQIVLTRNGVRGNIAQGAYGNSIRRVFLIYGMIGVVSFAAGVWSFLNRVTIAGVLYCLVGIFNVWVVFISRNNSATPVIERPAIRSVKANAPRPPFTRGYFVVTFEEAGKMRKRLIALPGSLDNGQEEYARAEAVMRACGLLP